MIAPLARALGADDVVATQLEEQGGQCTGARLGGVAIWLFACLRNQYVSTAPRQSASLSLPAAGRTVGPPMNGREKARAAAHYANTWGVPLERCAAYGDSRGDAEMLRAVGAPLAVNPDSGLRKSAPPPSALFFPAGGGEHAALCCSADDVCSRRGPSPLK